MKLFKCDNCGQPVYFENTFCIKCNATLGFEAGQLDMISLKKVPDGVLKPYNESLPQSGYNYCLNHVHNVCNWVLPFNSSQSYCIACDVNKTIPDISHRESWKKWQRIEAAKHRLIYSLLRFNLPVVSKHRDQLNGLAFDFLAQTGGPYGERLLTGHENGLITLNIEEADDAIRAMAQKQMDEVYRTLLGHFRHESGHYYWNILIQNTSLLQPFRNIFGNEYLDYAAALKAHYNKPTQNIWQSHYISAYASAHPWEDWAETWAHYLHIIDTMETAYSFGISLKPQFASEKINISTQLNIDPYSAPDFENIIGSWIPLTFVMNSLNRSMGLKDPYPFVITNTVKEKLNFIHNAIWNR